MISSPEEESGGVSGIQPPGAMVFDLPAKTDPAALARLYSLLSAHREQPVVLHMPPDFRPDSGVIQLVLVASAEWQGRGLDFHLTGAGSEQSALFDLAGLAPHLPLAPNPAMAEGASCP